MNYNEVSNVIGEAIVRSCLSVKLAMLDGNNFLWKFIDNKWVGKRSVWTFYNRACWLEDTTIDNVKSWWCGGKDADYSESFNSN